MWYFVYFSGRRFQIDKVTVQCIPYKEIEVKTIDKNVTSLLNLEPNSVLTPKSIPYKEIITAIESQVLNLESGKKDTSAQNLQQTVNKILSKTIGKKQQENLSKTQRTALKQL